MSVEARASSGEPGPERRVEHSTPGRGAFAGLSRGRRRVLYVAAVLAIALVFSAQNVAYWITAEKTFHWSKAVYWNLCLFAAWGALAPLVWGLAARYPVTGATWKRRLTVHVGLGLLLNPVHGLLFLLPNELLGLGLRVSDTVAEGYVNLLIRHVLPNLLTYGFIVTAWHARRLYAAYRERELRASRLEARLAETELRALKAQLHPHFLFNALNAISEFVHEDPERADRMVTRLAELLRGALARSREQEVALRDELAGLAPYLEVERARFEDQLRIDVDVDRDCLGARVPSMLLQPLVENAIRHGTERSPGPGRVSVRAERRDGRLEIAVRDDGPGPPVEAGALRTGIGLRNTRARLRQLYGDDAALRMVRAPGGGTEVRVEIPCRSGAGPRREPEREIRAEDPVATAGRPSGRAPSGPAA